MSKLPKVEVEIRLASDMKPIVERLLAPLTGKKLEAAQQAVLGVYQSKMQMGFKEWVEAYTEAVEEAVGAVKAAG